MLKSIWAIIAGFIVVVILSTATDMLLIKTEIMQQPFALNSIGFITFVVVYRCVYGTLGSYVTAKLSPANPMKHALIGGAIGFVIATLGAIAMWDTPPHWYPIALIVTTLPCAWLGGLLFVKNIKGR